MMMRDGVVTGWTMAAETQQMESGMEKRRPCTQSNLAWYCRDGYDVTGVRTGEKTGCMRDGMAEGAMFAVDK